MKINLGVEIDEDTFMKLSHKQQNLILYRNLKKSSWVHNVIHYLWLAALSGYVFLAKP